MNRTFAGVLLIAILSLATQVRAADGPVYDLTVKVDATKRNGSPWDGIPRLGNSNPNAAPDIAVCVVRPNTKAECLWREEGRRLLSRCQNAFTCKFPGLAIQPPVGLVFIDIDVRNHDVIDVAILAGNENAAADGDLKDSLRAALTMLTPNRSETTREHQVRDAKVLPLRDCVPSDQKTQTCRLTQSEFRLERPN